MKMTNTDIAGLLQTYAELARTARNVNHLRDIIIRLKNELDLRKLHIKMEGEEDE